MISVSNSFKNEMLSVSRNPKSFVILGNDTFIYDDNDYLKDYGWPEGDSDLANWTISSRLSGSLIGSFPARMLDLTVINVPTTYEFENKTVEVFVGFKYKTQDETEMHDTIDTISLGKFTVTEVKNIKSSFETKVKAIDKTHLFEQEYFDPRPFDIQNTLTTLKDYLKYICAVIGCPPPTKTFTLLEKITITKDPFIVTGQDNIEYKTPLTFRNVVGKIAESVGCFAFIDPVTDSLELSFFEGEVYDLGLQNYSKLEESDQATPPVDNLILARSPVKGDVVTPSSGVSDSPQNTILIVNNPVLDSPGNNQDVRSKFVDDIWAKIKGFSLTLLKMVLPGIPNVTLGDKFSYLNLENNNSVCFVTGCTLRYSGGLQSTIESNIEFSIGDKPEVMGDYSKAELNTEIIIDKQRGIINSLINKITIQGEEISRIKQEVDSITLSVMARGFNNLIRNSAGLIPLEIDNGDSWNYDFTDGTVATTQTEEDLNPKTVSNSAWVILGGKISQTIDGVINKNIKISALIKKPAGVIGTIEVSDGTRVSKIICQADEILDFESKTIVIKPSGSIFTITIYSSSRAAPFIVSDLMADFSGENYQEELPLTWSPARDEIYGTGVKIDRKGVQIFGGNEKSLNKTVITPVEFKGMYGESATFRLNKDITESLKFKSTTQIDMPPIIITSFPNDGWGFYFEGGGPVAI